MNDCQMKQRSFHLLVETVIYTGTNGSPWREFCNLGALFVLGLHEKGRGVDLLTGVILPVKTTLGRKTKARRDEGYSLL